MWLWCGCTSRYSASLYIKGLTDDPKVIRADFKTMSNNLAEFVQWLIASECYHIAMESTGGYIGVLYAIEELHSDHQSLMVVSAHHMRNLPGKKMM
jgi:transposase